MRIPFLLTLLLPGLFPLYAVAPAVGSGNDTVEGGADDTIEGGAGDDTIEGGQDTVQRAGDDTVPGGTPKKDAPLEDRMLAEISGKLKTTTTPGAKAPQTEDEKKAAADAAAKAKQEAAAKTEAELEKKELTELKAKKAADFELTHVEKKALGEKANQRFRQLTHYATMREGEVTTLAEQNKVLSAARDEILTAFEEHKAEPEDLVPLLQYNLTLKEGRWEEALKMVDEHRAHILTKLGREAPGVDLISEFPDLNERVNNQELARADALALAQSRRKEKESAAGRQSEAERKASEDNLERARETGLAAIADWEEKLKGKDVDYAKKRDKMQPRIQAIIQKYPPGLWLSTLQSIYEAIEVVKEPATETPDPLRPSGSKAGAKQPNDMLEALNQGLGYTT